MRMLPRRISHDIEGRLHNFRIVVLLAPRRSGKTTVATALASRLNASILQAHTAGELPPADGYNLTIIDDIHLKPQIISRLHACRRYILLSSVASDKIIRQLAKLGDEVYYLTMAGIDATEVDDINRLWLRGGVPDSYLAATDNELVDIHRDYLTKCMQSIRRVRPRLDTSAPEKLLLALAQCHGQTTQYTKVCKASGLSQGTLRTGLHTLSEAMLITAVEPWPDSSRSIKKSVRCYISDSGLLHSINGIKDYASLQQHPLADKSWQGFVLENIYHIAGAAVRIYYYQTEAGTEIDLLLKFRSNKEVWAVTTNSNNKTPQFTGACGATGATRMIVVPCETATGGKTAYTGPRGIESMSLKNFIGQIATAA